MPVRKRGWKAPLLLGAGAAMIPAAVLLREIAGARSCAAKGGEYDYARAICDMTGGTYEHFAERYEVAMWIGIVLAVKLAAIVAVTAHPPRFLGSWPTAIRSRVIHYAGRVLPG